MNSKLTTYTPKGKKNYAKNAFILFLLAFVTPTFGGGTYKSMLDFKNCRSGWLTSDFDIYESDPAMLLGVKDSHEQMLADIGSSRGGLVGGLYGKDPRIVPENEAVEKQTIVCASKDIEEDENGKTYYDISCYGDKDRPLSGTTFRSFHDPASEWYKAVHKCISGCDHSVVSALYETSSEVHINEEYEKAFRKYMEHCGAP